jgi:hypothetical protein
MDNSDKALVPKKFKIDPETAERDFERWADNHRLDLETELMDDEDLDGFKKQKRKVILAIMRGDLVINANNLAEYTPYHKDSVRQEPIIFNDRSGASMLAGTNIKKDDDGKKAYAVMGDMCKVHPSVFASLHGDDIKVCEALFALLMD